jgi:HSP20 family protein
MNNLQTQEREVAGTAHRQNSLAQTSAPPVDIHETRDAYILIAEMPGVRKDGLEITIEGSTLTMLGRCAEEPLPGAVLHRESKGADYRRVFELDPMIDTSKIRARVDQGLVTVELPKADQIKPRKIKVGD